MKKGFIIKRETAYISNRTGEIVNPSFQERLMDSIFTGDNANFCLIELYTKLAEVKGKTLKSLHQQTIAFAEKNNLYSDFELFICK